MSTVQDAIQAAKAAAAAMAPSNTEIVAHVSPAGVATPMMKPSMSMAAAVTSLVPRTAAYLKVNEFGLLVGKGDKKFKEKIRAKILMVEDKGFALKWTLRYGNPAQYVSTFDGHICDKGGSWADAQAKARAIDPRVEPYISADIVATLVEDVEITGGKVEAGSKVAINLSKTNFSEWQEFYAEMEKAGVIGQEITVDLGFRDIHHNGNDWGVVTFALVQ